MFSKTITINLNQIHPIREYKNIGLCSLIKLLKYSQTLLLVTIIVSLVLHWYKLMFIIIFNVTKCTHLQTRGELRWNTYINCPVFSNKKFSI